MLCKYINLSKGLLDEPQDELVIDNNFSKESQNTSNVFVARKKKIIS
jgi:hypothetical protein